MSNESKLKLEVIRLEKENEGLRAEIETLNGEIARLESFIARGSNQPIKGIRRIETARAKS